MWADAPLPHIQVLFTCRVKFPSPFKLTGSSHLPVSSALKADLKRIIITVIGDDAEPRSNLALYRQRSTFAAGQREAVCPQPWQRLHSFTVQSWTRWPSVPQLKHPSVGELPSTALGLLLSPSAVTIEQRPPVVAILPPPEPP